ncbi:ATP-dependent nuclease [Burkholderia vietnamiensis]|uniref:ATP-dependent nuclease n=1 Tax=Burkholderia vietnamiensis TaxID=60552 RepID=UPI00158D000B|nr:ATP-binding protein [Burkholderia vietnamiensis]QTK86457.1 ATP-binding protein [Burkholderia vietnamiensis]HDR9008252.1 ATP-binding protein [Burkholderia vietnamiensis]HDR9017568.1 ATP-binding protein [Burkholderia vietnamiensis]HDR9317254.1 ATP-binding protein [Burkholderia vietnamiensis]
MSNFSLSLDDVNVLTGPNNSGKSTIVGAFRALAVAMRVARARNPERVRVGEERPLGYQIRESLLPISLENVRTNYAETEARVTFRFSNQAKLHLIFPEGQGCVLVPEVPGAVVTSTTLFKRHFPLELAVVPILGPVEHRERLLERATVQDGLATHRASRHFRNYWHHFEEGFEQFATQVRDTWPGMSISKPELDTGNGELTMFVTEDRIDRELYWVGYGFQVWCQLLTHLSRVSSASLVIIDEPEVYLHPDVQRQLLTLLRNLGPDVLVATHSTEIIADADPSEIVLVDKRKRSAERLKDVAGVQHAMDVLGSRQNITLAALARNRRVLFTEGDYDYRLLRRFARRLGYPDLANGLGIAQMPSGGFGSWERVSVLAEGVAEALGARLMIGAIYDRDFFCEEQILAVATSLQRSLALAHVHERKEIENYLLVPTALDRCIEKALGERSTRGVAVSPFTVKSAEILSTITDSMKDDVQGTIIGNRQKYLRSTGKDDGTTAVETLRKIAPLWQNLSQRLCLVPGKEVLQRFRDKVSELYSVSITEAKVIDVMHLDEIADDMKALLRRLEQFRLETV